MNMGKVSERSWNLDVLTVGLNRGKKTAQIVEKNIWSIAAKRTLTLIDSTLELPVKEIREMRLKSCYINAGTYS